MSSVQASSSLTASDPVIKPAAGTESELRLLTFTTLYPNAVQHRHGIFVEQRLRRLLASERVTAKVVAPIPWFPLPQPQFGRYGEYAQVAKREQRHGIDVVHPRYPVIPKIGMTAAPWLLAAATQSTLLETIRRGGDFHLIDAHYFYPDGVAAAILGRRLGKPVVITARGADLNQIASYRLPRRMIRWAAQQAAGLITVSQPLKEKLIALGIDADKIQMLRNGVDLDLFRPLPQRPLRERLRLTGPTLFSVGHLIPRKRHHLVIEALAKLPNVELLIAGEGPERRALQKLSERLGVTQRVRFLGNLPQERLKEYYSAVDALVLASSSEGWANVLLEALACGTPVLASRVGSAPDIITTPASGLLLEPCTAEAIAAATQLLLDHPPDRAAVRRHAERFSWDDTSRGQLALFERIRRRTATVTTTA